MDPDFDIDLDFEDTIGPEPFGPVPFYPVPYLADNDELRAMMVDFAIADNHVSKKMMLR